MAEASVTEQAQALTLQDTGPAENGERINGMNTEEKNMADGEFVHGLSKETRNGDLYKYTDNGDEFAAEYNNESPEILKYPADDQKVPSAYCDQDSSQFQGDSSQQFYESPTSPPDQEIPFGSDATSFPQQCEETVGSHVEDSFSPFTSEMSSYSHAGSQDSFTPFGGEKDDQEVIQPSGLISPQPISQDNVLIDFGKESEDTDSPDEVLSGDANTNPFLQSQNTDFESQNMFSPREFEGHYGDDKPDPNGNAAQNVDEFSTFQQTQEFEKPDLLNMGGMENVQSAQPSLSSDSFAEKPIEQAQDVIENFAQSNENVPVSQNVEQTVPAINVMSDGTQEKQEQYIGEVQDQFSGDDDQDYSESDSNSQLENDEIIEDDYTESDDNIEDMQDAEFVPAAEQENSSQVQEESLVENKDVCLPQPANVEMESQNDLNKGQASNMVVPDDVPINMQQVDESGAKISENVEKESLRKSDTFTIETDSDMEERAVSPDEARFRDTIKEESFVGFQQAQGGVESFSALNIQHEVMDQDVKDDVPKNFAQHDIPQNQAELDIQRGNMFMEQKEFTQEGIVEERVPSQQQELTHEDEMLQQGRERSSDQREISPEQEENEMVSEEEFSSEEEQVCPEDGQGYDERQMTPTEQGMFPAEMTHAAVAEEQSRQMSYSPEHEEREMAERGEVPERSLSPSQESRESKERSVSPVPENQDTTQQVPESQHFQETQDQQTIEQKQHIQQSFEHEQQIFQEDQQMFEQTQQTFEQEHEMFQQGKETFEQEQEMFQQGQREQEMFQQGQQAFEQEQQMFQQGQQAFEKEQQLFQQSQETFEQEQEMFQQGQHEQEMLQQGQQSFEQEQQMFQQGQQAFEQEQQMFQQGQQAFEQEQQMVQQGQQAFEQEQQMVQQGQQAFEQEQQMVQQGQQAFDQEGPMFEPDQSSVKKGEMFQQEYENQQQILQSEQKQPSLLNNLQETVEQQQGMLQQEEHLMKQEQDEGQGALQDKESMEEYISQQRDAKESSPFDVSQPVQQSQLSQDAFVQQGVEHFDKDPEQMHDGYSHEMESKEQCKEQITDEISMPAESGPNEVSMQPEDYTQDDDRMVDEDTLSPESNSQGKDEIEQEDGVEPNIEDVEGKYDSNMADQMTSSAMMESFVDEGEGLGADADQEEMGEITGTAESKMFEEQQLRESLQQDITQLDVNSVAKKIPVAEIFEGLDEGFGKQEEVQVHGENISDKMVDVNNVVEDKSIGDSGPSEMALEEYSRDRIESDEFPSQEEVEKEDLTKTEVGIEPQQTEIVKPQQNETVDSQHNKVIEPHQEPQEQVVIEPSSVPEVSENLQLDTKQQVSMTQVKQEISKVVEKQEEVSSNKTIKQTAKSKKETVASPKTVDASKEKAKGTLVKKGLKKDESTKKLTEKTTVKSPQKPLRKPKEGTPPKESKLPSPTKSGGKPPTQKPTRTSKASTPPKWDSTTVMPPPARVISTTRTPRNIDAKPTEVQAQRPRSIQRNAAEKTTAKTAGVTSPQKPQTKAQSPLKKESTSAFLARMSRPTQRGSTPKKDGSSDSGVEDDKTGKQEQETMSQESATKKKFGIDSHNTSYKPGGGNVKITHQKVSTKNVTSRIDARSTTPTSSPTKPKPVSTPSPKIPDRKNVQSKIGSLDNARHTPGGGKVKIQSQKVDYSTVQSRTASKDNIKHKAGGGTNKIESKKLNWNAESRIGSLENAKHSPGGGKVKILDQKVKWNTQSKIGSLDNASHSPGGGNVKIESHKLEFKAESKIGSKDYIDHKPGGGDKKIQSQKLDFKEKASSKIGSKDNIEHKPGGGDKKIESQKLNFKDTAKSRTDTGGSSNPKSRPDSGISQDIAKTE